MKRESTLEKYFVKKVRESGGMAIKLNPMGMAGLPDRLALFPGGQAVFVELKRPGEKPRKLQEYMHNKLRRLGFSVKVVDSNETIKRILTEAAE